MNKRTYCNVTQQAMEALLLPLGFEQLQGLKIEGRPVVELVYAKRVVQGKLQLSLRVFTGINPSGESRECGEDAIRVQLALRDDEGRIFPIKGEKRVNRIQTWRDNLMKRLDKWADELMPSDTCECGSPMVVRETRDGKRKFLGCVRYPHCNGTRNIKTK